MRGGGGEKESGNFAKRKEKVNISWAGLKRFSSRPASSHLDPWSGEDGLLVRERERERVTMLPRGYPLG